MTSSHFCKPALDDSNGAPDGPEPSDLEPGLGDDGAELVGRALDAVDEGHHGEVALVAKTRGGAAVVGR